MKNLTRACQGRHLPLSNRLIPALLICNIAIGGPTTSPALSISCCSILAYGRDVISRYGGGNAVINSRK